MSVPPQSWDIGTDVRHVMAGASRHAGGAVFRQRVAHVLVLLTCMMALVDLMILLASAR
jgi:hypothetical protein